jgi:hypothetical protein
MERGARSYGRAPSFVDWTACRPPRQNPHMTRRSFPPRWSLALAFVLALAAPACREESTREEDHVKRPSRPISAVLADHSPKLMALTGVTAVGESALPDGTPCIKVFLRSKDRELRRRIPRSIEGYTVVTDVSGEIRALPDSR